MKWERYGEREVGGERSSNVQFTSENQKLLKMQNISLHVIFMLLDHIDNVSLHFERYGIY